LHEFDLSELGLSQPLVLFELNQGRILDIGNKLDPKRDYGLICDSDLSVKGANQTVRIVNGCAHRIPSESLEAFTVTCDGALYWLPRTGERKTPGVIKLSMELYEETFAHIDSEARLVVHDVPVDTLAVKLTIGCSSFQLIREGDSWITNQPVKIGLRLAMGEECVRVRVTGRGFDRSVAPALHLRLVGIAHRQGAEDGDTQWGLVKRGRPLDRTYGLGQARVFAGGNGESLYEGFRQIGKLSSRALDMNALQGWGEPLIAGPHILAESVEDHGLFTFLPNLFRRETGQRLVWRVPTPPGDDYRIAFWSDLSRPPKMLDTGGFA
jgi:hypothetical protein